MSAPFFSESYGNTSDELRQETSGFSVFIHSRLDDYGLPAPAFRVYCHLARRAGHGSAWPAVAGIARVCRLHPQTVRKALRLLVLHQLLKREPRSGNTTLYRLTPASVWRPPARIDSGPSEIDTPPSVSKGGAAKPMPGRSTEMNIAKGGPSEGNPVKRKHTGHIKSLPSSENEAIKEAQILEIPAEFARQEFNRLAAVGWLDGCKRPVMSWSHYLKQRWSNEQRLNLEGRSSRHPSTRRPPAPPRQFNPGDYQQSVENF